ncbi:MAG: glycosyl hydrolase 115 family protein, partial [Verrucomicrobiales bacterium]|nr:glycosyl hydrolase 115 family protein [Verrucomicrobiales bacterium]
KPSLKTNLAYAGQYAVVIATLEKSPIANDLMRARAFDSAHIRGQWESFVITTVTNPSPKIAHALLIIGSDRRGTAFGVYELARAIGVSPWYWWADVTPTPKRAIYVAPGTRKFGPPSVKYRGIFINDEDWGLHLWAANTFEPEAGGIGPKTYARVFELLLRLKANTLWPAMHACTKPFNHFPENKHLADDYAIVIGSSHAEPMLRNNVSEWRDPPESFNYATNRERVLKYWEERVIENGKFENIYTLGMRGIHDSPMQGARTIQDRLRLIEQIVADQRGLLAKHVNRQLEAVPQVFCAYKEVLELYRAGLNLPEDVTIMWPDDNFGYICHFATMSERKRKGGFGVYYHISYLGRPLAYLWLCTTPPALIWEEMTKAYAHGADRVWIVNVGDIKPAEICTEFFLELAWDVNRWTRTNLTQFLEQWAAREFGSDLAHDIADVMAKYYQLNYQRKPEHLQWWLPGEPPRPSPFTASEPIQRLTNFDALQARAERLNNLLAPEKRDAFFQLVLYPVKASALANARYFHGEMSALAAAAGRPEEARAAADMAISADIQLRALTRRFNEEIAGGKWRGLMNLEPADHQWRSMRIAAWTLPKFELTNAPSPTTHTNLGPTKANERQPAPGFSGFVERNGVVSIEAEHFTSNQPGKHGAWEIIPGLGRSGDSVAVFPTTAASTPIERLRTDAPRLGYTVWFGSTGEVTVHIYLVPTHPIPPRNKLRLAIGINAEPPQSIELEVKVGSRTWAQSVLDAARIGSVKLDVPRPGPHTLRVYGVDPGVVVDKIVIDCGGMEPSYLGPTETFTGNQPDR